VHTLCVGPTSDSAAADPRCHDLQTAILAHRYGALDKSDLLLERVMIQVHTGLGRIVASHGRPSTSYQIHDDNR
jgi:hypothetical protein